MKLALTVAADEGHSFIAAVGEKGSIAASPGVGVGGGSPNPRLAPVLLVLAGADADDAMHQSALGLALLQVEVLGDAVNELADLVGLAGEGGVGGAAGQLVDLVQSVQLQQLLADQRVHIAQLLRLLLLVVVQREQTGTADGAPAVPTAPSARRSIPLRGGNRVHHCLASDANVRVAEAVAGGQLRVSAWLAVSSPATYTPWGAGLCARFRRVVRGALGAGGGSGQARLPATVEATGEQAADQGLAGAPAQGTTGTAGVSARRPAAVSRAWDKPYSLRPSARPRPGVAAAAGVSVVVGVMLLLLMVFV